MPIEFAEDLLENDDFKVLTDGNGDLIQEHKQTGAQFKFDSTKNRWIPVQGLDLEGADIDGVGSVSTGDIDVDKLGNNNTYEQLFEVVFDNADDIRDEWRITRDVSTSATEIARVPDNIWQAGVVLVQGDSESGANAFWEIVLFARGQGATVIATLTKGVVDSRTYSSDGAALDLAMDGGTWNVMTRTLNFGGVTS